MKLSYSLYILDHMLSMIDMYLLRLENFHWNMKGMNLNHKLNMKNYKTDN